jgi:hypothetical protein
MRTKTEFGLKGSRRKKETKVGDHDVNFKTFEFLVDRPKSNPAAKAHPSVPKHDSMPSTTTRFILQLRN